MPTINQNELAQEAFQYREINPGSNAPKKNGHLQQTKLSQSKIEVTYLKTHQSALSKYMHNLGVNSDNKRAINKLYKRLVTLDNIMKVYSHPMQVFFNQLITGNLKPLHGASSAVFSPKLSTLKSQKS